MGLFESRDDSSDAESEMQEPSLNELLPALSQFAHSKPGFPRGQDSREENERQEYQYDDGNDEMIELQLVGNSENGTIRGDPWRKNSRVAAGTGSMFLAQAL